MAMPVVDGAVRNLKKVRDHIDNGMDDILSVVAGLAESHDTYEGNPDIENIKALEKVMLDYASMERSLNQFTMAVSQVKDGLKASDSVSLDVKSMLDACYQDLAKDNSTKELKGHCKVLEFNNRLHDLQEADADGSGPSSAADLSLGEADLVMTQTELGTKCPFTQQEMANPVRNAQCGHHYEKRGIEELLKKRKKIKCPLPGCTNTTPIQTSHLEVDMEFKRQIEKQRRARKRKQVDTMTQ